MQSVTVTAPPNTPPRLAEVMTPMPDKEVTEDAAANDTAGGSFTVMATEQTGANAVTVQRCVDAVAGTACTTFANAAAGNIGGIYGNFTLTNAGAWTYTLDNQCGATPGIQGTTADAGEAGDPGCATDALAANVMMTDVLRIRADDGTADATTAAGSGTSRYSSTEEVTVTITGANDAPTVVAIGNQPAVDSGTSGAAYSQPLTGFFEDVDTGTTLTYALSGTCTGFVVSGNNLVGSGASGIIPSTVTTDTTCMVTATDGTATSPAASLAIVITASPDDTPRMELVPDDPATTMVNETFTVTATNVMVNFQRVAGTHGSVDSTNDASVDVTPTAGRYLPADKVVATIPAGEMTASVTITRTTANEPVVEGGPVGQLFTIAATSGTSTVFTAPPGGLIFINMVDSVPYFGLADATPAATADPFNVTVMRQGNNGAAADVRWTVANADASDPVAVAVPATLAGAGTLSFAASDGTSNRSGTIEVERTVPGPAGTGNGNITVGIIPDPADPDTYGQGSSFIRTNIPISRAPAANTAPTVVGSATADSATEGMAYSQPLAPFFNDADGDTLTFAITSCPGFALNTAGTHLVGTGAGGVVTVSSTATCAITATDVGGTNTTVPTSFSITVFRITTNVAPFVLNNPTVEDATPGMAYSMDLDRFYNDVDNDPLTFGLMSGTCAGFKLNEAGTPAGALAGTHLVGTGAGGVVTVYDNAMCTITATDVDGTNTAVETSFTITVIVPPVVVSLGTPLPTTHDADGTAAITFPLVRTGDPRSELTVAIKIAIKSPGGVDRRNPYDRGTVIPMNALTATATIPHGGANRLGTAMSGDTITVTIGVSTGQSYTISGNTSFELAVTGNTPPTVMVTGDSASLTEDSTTTSRTGTLTVADADQTPTLQYCTDTGTECTSFTAATVPGDIPGTYGTFALTATAWTYTLDNADDDTNALAGGAMVEDNLRLRADDGVGGISAVVAVEITITGVNDKPVITPATSLSITEDQAHTFAQGNFNYMDAEGGAFSIIFGSAPVIKDDTGTSAGHLSDATDSSDLMASDYPETVHFSALGNYAYNPVNRSRTYTAQMMVTPRDSANLDGDPKTLEITVTADNEAPTVALAIPDDAATAMNPFNLPISGNFRDADTDQTLTYSASVTYTTDGVSQTTLPVPAPGSSGFWLKLNTTSGIFSGTPEASDVIDALTVVVTASDGHTPTAGTETDTFMLVVRAGNTAVAAADDAIGITEDGGSVMVNVTTAADSGVAGDGTARDAGVGGGEDGAPNVLSYVTGDQKAGYPNTGTTPAGTALEHEYGSLTINADGDATYTLDTQCGSTPGMQGSAVDADEAGDFGCTPNALKAGQVVTDVFTYQVADKSAAAGFMVSMDTALVTVTITGANNDPVLAVSGTPKLNVTEAGATRSADNAAYGSVQHRG